MAAALVGCTAVPQPPSNAGPTRAQLTPPSPATRDLLKLPEPAGQVPVAVYGFRDQTGQYKPAPDSSFSTTVTQGGATILVKALKDSGWFLPVERENLQDVLTERRIIRALEEGKGNTNSQYPALSPAAILIDGGIISYESNVRTGGAGARFLGVGMSTQYRVDQVTVGLRTIDIRNSHILHAVSTTKTIYSYEIRPSVFKFVNFKELLEVEAGITRNEPAQLSVKEAIESALIHLIIKGMQDGSWVLKNQNDWHSPIIQRYVREDLDYLAIDALDEEV